MIANQNNNAGGLMPDLSKPQTLIDGAGMLTGFVPGGHVMQPVFDLASNEYAMDEVAAKAAKAVGQTKATLVADSPAFKRFEKEMRDRQPTETLIKSLSALAGAVLGGVLLAAFPFGGIIGAIGGGIAGTYIASSLMESKHFDFEPYANGLEAQSRNKTLSGEQTFVALLLNLENKKELEGVLKSYGFTKKSELVDALATNPAIVTQMMREQDSLIRDSYQIKNTHVRNPQTGGEVTGSEMMAAYFNTDAAIDPVTGYKGSNLLSGVATADASFTINRKLIQIEQSQMQQQSQYAAMQPRVPDVPNLRGAERTI